METRGDAAAYALAVLLLVVGGAVLRTPILNWIVGPAIVVGVVSGVGALRDRRRT